MRKLNLTAVVALAFLSKAGYGMDLSFDDVEPSVPAAAVVAFNDSYSVRDTGIEILQAPMREGVLPLVAILQASCAGTILQGKIPGILGLMSEEPIFESDGGLAEAFMAPYQEIVDYAKSDYVLNRFENPAFNDITQVLALRTTPGYYLRNLAKLVAIPQETLPLTKELIVSILKAQVGNKAERLAQIERVLDLRDDRSISIMILMNNVPSIRAEVLGFFGGSGAAVSMAGSSVICPAFDDAHFGAPVTVSSAAASSELTFEELPESAQGALSMLGLQESLEVLSGLARLPRAELNGFFNEVFIGEILSSENYAEIIQKKIIRLMPRK